MHVTGIANISAMVQLRQKQRAYRSMLITISDGRCCDLLLQLRHFVATKCMFVATNNPVIIIIIKEVYDGLHKLHVCTKAYTVTKSRRKTSNSTVTGNTL